MTTTGQEAVAIHGTCDPKFALVREEFVRNFEERGEVGASVCVTLAGETVVDLWGGVARPDTGAPWQEDTVCLVASCTKGATALCAHILASRGLLDLDTPVVQYWPEFGQAGKQDITVKMLLNHQAGVVHIRQPLPKNAYHDWELMTRLLASEAPFWQPGTRSGYHALAFGWLVGEVVRRISGKSLGTFFQDEVAKPLGLDFWIGLPEAVEVRVAPAIPAPPPGADEPQPRFLTAMADQNSLQYLVFMNSGGSGIDTRAGHAAEIPAANGITHGRGLAGMYAPLACGGSLKGVQLVDRETLARMGAVSSASGEDAVSLVPTRYALGYHKSFDNRRLGPGLSVILAEEGFGHAGAGGSLGFADPRARLSFGYAMNQRGAEVYLNPRGQSLVDAAYRSLGYTSNASGAWI